MITKVNNCKNCPYLIYDDANGNDCHYPDSEVNHYELPEYNDNKSLPEKCPLKNNNVLITLAENITQSDTIENNIVIKEFLEKAFDAGYDCSLSHNNAESDGYFDFDEFYKNEIGNFDFNNLLKNH